MRKSSLRLFATAALITTVLAACGGGGGSGGNSDTATGSTGTTGSTGSTGGLSTATSAQLVSGTITGFGSVIIDGQRFDDSAVNVSIDSSLSTPAGGTLSDLKLGMQVQGTLSGGVLSDVMVRASAVGAVGSVDLAASTFTVYSQTISVTTTGATPTIFEGVSGLSAIAVGDVVEVHGTLGANSQIVATRVERKARTDTAGGVRLAGLVTALSGTSFQLGDLTVDFSGATVVPTGKAVANGQLVAVFADAAPVGNKLTAKGVRIATADDGAGYDVGGRIMAFVSVSDFTVSGIKVDGSSATFVGGVAADLALGVGVAVEGTMTAGVLKATKVRVLKTPEDVKASLSGTVTDFVTNASFKVRGTAVDASAAAYTGGTASDLGNGANVKVAGKIQGDLLKADTVEFTAPAATGAIKLKGEIRDLDASAGTFHFLGVNLKLNSDVAYLDGTAADLANGKRVEVTGTAAAALAAPASAASAPPLMTPTLNVSQLQFLPALAPRVSVVGGRVNALGASGFKLPGVNIVINTDTAYTGGVAADLSNGIEVLVSGLWNPQLAALVATSVEIHKPAAATTGAGNGATGNTGGGSVASTGPAPASPPMLTVRGAITDFASSSSFRIAGQKVDASAATLTGGSLPDLGNALTVEATGVIAGVEGARYLMLSTLRIIR
jgi:hypothetical protein